MYPSTQVFISQIAGAKIEKVFRIAKVILFTLLKGSEIFYISVHLAMTGRLYLKTKDSRGGKVLVQFNISGNQTLYFTDQRRFGFVKLISEVDVFNLQNKYGLDPFEATSEGFKNNLKSKNTNIKNALLDQSIIAGVGNIYANDALFMAKINPMARTNSITDLQYSYLYNSVRTILQEGIEHKGSTLDDFMYMDIYGNYGEHQNYFRVYGRNNLGCSVCNSKVEFVTLNGRGTFYCAKCQPLDNELRLNI